MAVRKQAQAAEQGQLPAAAKGESSHASWTAIREIRVRTGQHVGAADLGDGRLPMPGRG